jgi:hypothetical protein
LLIFRELAVPRFQAFCLQRDQPTDRRCGIANCSAGFLMNTGGVDIVLASDP